MSAHKRQQDAINRVGEELERIFNSEVITEEDWTILATYGALLIEVMKRYTPSKLDSARTQVEITYRIKL